MNRVILGGFGGVAAGISIFWLYILSESVLKTSGTNASLVSPAASLVGLAFLAKTVGFKRFFQSKASKNPIVLTFAPILRPIVYPIILLISFLTLFIWTDKIIYVLAFLFSITLSLMSLLFIPSRSQKKMASFTSSLKFQLFLIFFLELTFLIVLKELPLMAQSKSLLLISVLPIPVALIAVLRLFALPENVLSSAPSQAPFAVNIQKSVNSLTGEIERGKR